MACARGCCATQLDHYRSIRLSAEATPTKRSKRYEEITQREKNWEKDIPAAKRLFKQGVEIKSVDGAAEMEAKATTKLEMESGQLMNKKQKEQYNAVVETGNEYAAKPLPLAE